MGGGCAKHGMERRVDALGLKQGLCKRPVHCCVRSWREQKILGSQADPARLGMLRKG